MNAPRIIARRDRGIEPWLYQRYYHDALRAASPGARLRGFPPGNRIVRRLLRNRSPRRGAGEFPEPVSPQCGAYIFEDSGVRHWFAIDAHDAPGIADPALLEWADTYFKANHWPGNEYPDKVVPVVNGNGELTVARVRKLRTLRNRPKQWDFVFISRIWGGVEHNTRLFETLASLPGRKRLLAVIPPATGAFRLELDEAVRRLNACGVETTGMPVPPNELWEALAASRVVLLRAGKHLCLPWRTLDLLAMGSAIVLESAPRPAWPVPLTAGREFLCAGLERPVDTGPAPVDQYSGVSRAVQFLLANEGERSRISAAAAAYFDQHAAPAAVGRWIRQVIDSRGGVGE